VETVTRDQEAKHATAGRRMAGRVCLVTGGGSGIGLATALLMAREGAAAVVIAGRREQEGEEAAEQCRAAGAASLFLRTDASVEAEVERLVQGTLEHFGRLDVAFNNAGFQERRAPLEQQEARTYETVFGANVRSVFFCLKHQVRAMEGRGGAIVNNASVSGTRNPNPGLALYSASKAAVISLTRSAAMECAPRGIRINAVSPGRVVTDMMRGSGIDLGGVAAGLPLKRMGEPREVAEVVLWLASDAASFVVGHVLAADGGFLAA